MAPHRNRLFPAGNIGFICIIYVRDRLGPRKGAGEPQQARRTVFGRVALFDPNAITVEDETAEGERRYVSIGLDGLGRILVVVFSYREDEIRLISVRKATRRERTSYEEGI